MIVEGRAYEARQVDVDYVQVCRGDVVVGAFRRESGESGERVLPQRSATVIDLRALYAIARDWFALEHVDGAPRLRRARRGGDDDP